MAAAVALLLWAPGAVSDPADLVRTIVDRYALIVFGAAALLAIAFHRSRVLTLVVAVGMVEVAARQSIVEPEAASLIGAGLALLLGMGALARDRGVTSWMGLAQMLAGLGWTASWMAAAVLHPHLLSVFGRVGDPASWTESVTGAADAFAGCILAGLLAVGLAAYRRRAPVERAAVWSLAMVAAAAHPELGPPAASLGTGAPR